MDLTLDEQRLQRLNQDKSRFVQALLRALEQANRVPEKTAVRVEVGSSVVYDGVPGQIPRVDKLDPNSLTLLLNALKVPGYEQPINRASAYAQFLDKGSVRIKAYDEPSVSVPQRPDVDSFSSSTPVQAPTERKPTWRDQFNNWVAKESLCLQPELHVVDATKWLLDKFGNPAQRSQVYFAEDYTLSYDDKTQQYMVASDRGDVLLQFKHSRQGLDVISCKLSPQDVQAFKSLSEQRSNKLPLETPVARSKHLGVLAPRGDSPFEIDTRSQHQPFVYSELQLNYQLGDICDYLLDFFGSRENGTQKYQAENYSVFYDEKERDYRVFDSTGNFITHFRKDNLSPYFGVQILHRAMTPEALHDFSGVVHTLNTPAALNRVNTPQERVYFLGNLAPVGDKAKAQNLIASQLGETLQRFMQIMQTSEFEGSAYRIDLSEQSLVVTAKDPRGVVLDITNGVVRQQKLAASDVKRLSAFAENLEQDVSQVRDRPRSSADASRQKER
jgi:hypothetical protein